MDLITIANLDVIVLLLGFLVNYLLEPEIRKIAANMVFFPFAVLLILYGFKMSIPEK
jgi:hypothetical protein